MKKILSILLTSLLLVTSILTANFSPIIAENPEPQQGSELPEDVLGRIKKPADVEGDSQDIELVLDTTNDVLTVKILSDIYNELISNEKADGVLMNFVSDQIDSDSFSFAHFRFADNTEITHDGYLYLDENNVDDLMKSIQFLHDNNNPRIVLNYEQGKAPSQDYLDNLTHVRFGIFIDQFNIESKIDDARIVYGNNVTIPLVSMCDNGTFVWEYDYEKITDNTICREFYEAYTSNKDALQAKLIYKYNDVETTINLTGSNVVHGNIYGRHCDYVAYTAGQENGIFCIITQGNSLETNEFENAYIKINGKNYYFLLDENVSKNFSLDKFYTLKLEDGLTYDDIPQNGYVYVFDGNKEYRLFYDKRDGYGIRDIQFRGTSYYYIKDNNCDYQNIFVFEYLNHNDDVSNNSFIKIFEDVFNDYNILGYRARANNNEYDWDIFVDPLLFYKDVQEYPEFNVEFCPSGNFNEIIISQFDSDTFKKQITKVERGEGNPTTFKFTLKKYQDANFTVTTKRVDGDQTITESQIHRFHLQTNPADVMQYTLIDSINGQDLNNYRFENIDAIKNQFLNNAIIVANTRRNIDEIVNKINDLGESEFGKNHQECHFEDPYYILNLEDGTNIVSKSYGFSNAIPGLDAPSITYTLQKGTLIETITILLVYESGQFMDSVNIENDRYNIWIDYINGQKYTILYCTNGAFVPIDFLKYTNYQYTKLIVNIKEEHEARLENQIISDTVFENGREYVHEATYITNLYAIPDDYEINNDTTYKQLEEYRLNNYSGNQIMKYFMMRGSYQSCQQAINFNKKNVFIYEDKTGKTGKMKMFDNYNDFIAYSGNEPSIYISMEQIGEDYQANYLINTNKVINFKKYETSNYRLAYDQQNPKEPKNIVFSEVEVRDKDNQVVQNPSDADRLEAAFECLYEYYGSSITLDRNIELDRSVILMHRYIDGAPNNKETDRGIIIDLNGYDIDTGSNSIIIPCDSNVYFVNRNAENTRIKNKDLTDKLPIPTNISKIYGNSNEAIIQFFGQTMRFIGSENGILIKNYNSDGIGVLVSDVIDDFRTDVKCDIEANIGIKFAENAQGKTHNNHIELKGNIIANYCCLYYDSPVVANISTEIIIDTNIRDGSEIGAVQFRSNKYGILSKGNIDLFAHGLEINAPSPIVIDGGKLEFRDIYLYTGNVPFNENVTATVENTNGAAIVVDSSSPNSTSSSIEIEVGGYTKIKSSGHIIADTSRNSKITKVYLFSYNQRSFNQYCDYGSANIFKNVDADVVRITGGNYPIKAGAFNSGAGDYDNPEIMTYVYGKDYKDADGQWKNKRTYWKDENTGTYYFVLNKDVSTNITTYTPKEFLTALLGENRDKYNFIFVDLNNAQSNNYGKIHQNGKYTVMDFGDIDLPAIIQELYPNGIPADLIGLKKGDPIPINLTEFKNISFINDNIVLENITFNIIGEKDSSVAEMQFENCNIVNNNNKPILIDNGPNIIIQSSTLESNGTAIEIINGRIRTNYLTSIKGSPAIAVDGTENEGDFASANIEGVITGVNSPAIVINNTNYTKDNNVIHIGALGSKTIIDVESSSMNSQQQGQQDNEPKYPGILIKDYIVLNLINTEVNGQSYAIKYDDSAADSNHNFKIPDGVFDRYQWYPRITIGKNTVLKGNRGIYLLGNTEFRCEYGEIKAEESAIDCYNMTEISVPFGTFKASSIVNYLEERDVTDNENRQKISGGISNVEIVDRAIMKTNQAEKYDYVCLQVEDTTADYPYAVVRKYKGKEIYENVSLTYNRNIIIDSDKLDDAVSEEEKRALETSEDKVKVVITIRPETSKDSKDDFKEHGYDISEFYDIHINKNVGQNKERVDEVNKYQFIDVSLADVVEENISYTNYDNIQLYHRHGNGNPKPMKKLSEEDAMKMQEECYFIHMVGGVPYAGVITKRFSTFGVGETNSIVQVGTPKSTVSLTLGYENKYMAGTTFNLPDVAQYGDSQVSINDVKVKYYSQEGNGNYYSESFPTQPGLYTAEWTINEEYDVHGSGKANFAIIPQHNHEFNKQVTTEKYLATAATCTELAKYYYSCECGEKGDQTFTYGQLADHKFDNEVISDKYLASAATCTEPAKYYYSCECGEKGTTTFTSGSALNHTLNHFDAKTSTCISKGNKEYWYCETCHKYFLSQEAMVAVDYDTYIELPLKDHSFTKYISNNDATCTTNGTKTAVCDQEGCNKTDTITDIGSAKGHAFASSWSKDDTYHWHAATCEHTSETKDKAEHVWNQGVETIPATHKSAGLMTYTCTECGQTKTEEIGKITEHKFNKQVTTEDYLASVATCTELAKYYYSCECGEKGTQTFTYGQLADHEFNKQVTTDEYLATAATCTELAKYYYSCECGEKGDQTFTYGQLADHKFDKEVISDKYLASAATCTEPAKYYYSCECGEKGTQLFSVGEALGHSYFKVDAIIIDSNLIKEHYACLKCDKIFDMQKVPTTIDDLTKPISDVNSGLNNIVTDDIPADQVPTRVKAIIEELGDSEAFKKIIENNIQNTDQGSILDTIKSLEAKTNKPTNKKIDENVRNIFESDDISIVGASLNAGASDTCVDFNVSTAENPTAIIDEVSSRFDTTKAIGFSLNISIGSNEISLTIPVIIELPVPESLDINKIKLIHRHNNTNEIVNIHKFTKNNKHYIRFVVTGFSDFMFVEERAQEPRDNRPRTDKYVMPKTGVR